MKKLKSADEIKLKQKTKNWNFKDLEGQRFGKLYVAGYLGKPLMNANTYWLMHCDCGSYVRATTGQLTGGKVTDCGCFKKLQCASRQNKTKTA